MVPARTSALLVTAIFSLRLKKTSTYTAVRICEASSLCEELRRPPGGRAQQALYSLGSEDQQDRVDECGLTHAGAAGDDRYPTGQRGLQCLLLARSQSLSSLLLAPGDCLFEVDLRVGNAGSGQPLHLRSDAVLRFPQVRQEDQRFAVALFQQEKPIGQHPVSYTHLTL